MTTTDKMVTLPTKCDKLPKSTVTVYDFVSPNDPYRVHWAA